MRAADLEYALAIAVGARLAGQGELEPATVREHAARLLAVDPEMAAEAIVRESLARLDGAPMDLEAVHAQLDADPLVRRAIDILAA